MNEDDDNKIKLDYSDKTLKKNSILTLLFRFLSMSISFMSAPLMLQCLGKEKYGVWASLLSIISWIYYCDIGIGGGLQNRLATALAKDDEDSAVKIIGSAYLSLSILSFVAFIILAIVFNVVEIEQLLKYDTIGENISIIITAALLFACVNFVAQLVNNILFALQKSAMVTFFNTLSQLFMLIFLFLYSKTGSRLLLVVAIGNGVCNFLKNVIATFYVGKVFPKIKVAIHNLNFSYSKHIMSFGVQVFVMNIAALILNTTDNLVISRYFGAEKVTPYDFCYKFFGIIQTVYVAIITPFYSAYTAAYAKQEYKWMLNNIARNVAWWLLFSMASVVASFVFKPFSVVWLQQDLGFPKGLIPLTATYFILLMFSHILSTFIGSTYQLHKTIIPTIIMTVINVPVSIVCSVNCGMGLNGVILGSIISQVIGVSAGTIVMIGSIKSLKAGRGIK